MKRQMIMLENLNCPACAGKLEQASKKLPGMKEAKVAFGSGTLRVEYDESVLTESQIRDAVKRLDVDIVSIVNG